VIKLVGIDALKIDERSSRYFKTKVFWFKFGCSTFKRRYGLLQLLMVINSITHFYTHHCIHGQSRVVLRSSEAELMYTSAVSDATAQARAGPMLQHLTGSQSTAVEQISCKKRLGSCQNLK